MTPAAKTPETSETIARTLLAEVKQRGLSAYCWDGQLHFLPAKLANANRDLITRLHQHHDAVIRELEAKRSQSLRVTTGVSSELARCPKFGTTVFLAAKQCGTSTTGVSSELARSAKFGGQRTKH